MADNIKVAIRVRQLIQKELSAGLKSHWTVKNETICCDDVDINGRKPTPYIFDRVFDDTSVTMDVFEDICKPIVDSALAGFNGTIFAYGQSSSGKTFTMSGSRVQPGIISLAVDEIFSYIENIPDREFLIRVGYLEIYNEKVSDLLNSDDTSTIKLQEDNDRNIQVVGMTEEVVKDVDGVSNVLKRGDAKRHTAETKQNDRSSRSHCILRFVIESRMVGHEDDAVKVSNLYFVDLAGSEKAGDNSGDRFREGCAINKSLFTLGMVIRKLSGDVNQQHVSFRDSKLTRILQNALGGNSKTAIISTITPAHVEESDSTLKFASRAKNIKNKPTVNEVMNDAAMMKKYRLTIKKLESQIKEMNETNTDLEKAELEMRLEEKVAAEKQQADMIAKLQAMIVTSGSGSNTEPPMKKRRRETWCPGKAQRELNRLGSIPQFSPPQIRELKPPSRSLNTKVLTETIQEEEMPETIDSVFEKDWVSAQQEATSEADETIHMNPTVKELFELQDKHEILKEELEKKDAELLELQEFTSLEREAEAEMIKDLKEKNKALEANLPWLEEELMKAQQERNSLRQKVETMNLKLTAVEDGSGMTEKARKLSETESKVGNLNSELDIQKSRYEFHIEQMKKKLETYTGLLEEKGIDSESIKQRLIADGVQNEAITELKTKHEHEVSELRNEVDMLVLELEKEKKKISEICDQYELEFEDQKARYQKDNDEAREEIEIYQQLLKEEKAKTESSGSEECVVDCVTKLKEKIDSQKEQFETELQALKEEKSKYEDKENTLKDTYETELKKLKEELHELKDLAVGRGLNMNELNEDVKINDQLFTEENHESCSKKELENSSASTMEAKLEYQREKHEAELNEMKIEVVKYMDIVENLKTVITSDVEEKSDVKKIEHEQQIAALQKKYDSEKNKLKEILDCTKSHGISQGNEKYESQISDLKEEINKYAKALEEETGKLMNTQKDLEDAKEEIGIYCQLLEEKNLCENGLTTETAAEMMKMKAEFTAQQESYETQLIELRKEITKHSDIVKLQQEDSFTQKDANSEIKLQKERYEEEIKQLKTELANYANIVSLTSVESGGDEQIMVAMEEQCDGENSKLKEKLDSNTYEEKIHQVKKHVNFDVYSEMEMQKIKYSLQIKELSEERDAYQKILEENQNCDNGSVELESVKNKHNEEMKAMKAELDKYIDLYENEKRNETSMNSVKDIIQGAEGELRQNKLENESNEMINSLQKETHSVEMDRIKTKHEEEVKMLKAEIKSYAEVLEQERVRTKNVEDDKEKIRDTRSEMTASEIKHFTSIQRELEFKEHENAKQIYEQKIEELNDEIKIYVELFEEEKSKNEKVGTKEISSRDEIESELESVKVKYSEEVLRLQNEMKLYIEMYESEKEKNELKADVLSDSRNFNDEIKEIEEKHTEEIEKMKEEFKKFVEENFQNTSSETEMEEVKLRYDQEIADLKSELNTYIELYGAENENKISESEMASDCNSQPDLNVEKLVTELEALKIKHQAEIEEMKKELNSVKELLEIEHSKNSSQNDKIIKYDMEQLEINYKRKINVLEQELAKYSALSGNETLKDSDSVWNSDLQAQILKTEIADIKEKHVRKVEELQEQISLLTETTEKEKTKYIVSVDTEKSDLQSEIISLTEKYEGVIKEMMLQKSQLLEKEMELQKLKEGNSVSISGNTDLQTELLRAEIVSMKEKHGEEVEEMQNQISLYSEMLNEKPKDSNNVNTDASSDLQSELLRAEIASMKEKHGEEVEELQNQISLFSEMLNEKPKDSNNVNTDASSDLQTELLRAEIASMKEKHGEEVEEMQTQILLYSEMLNEKPKDSDNINTDANSDLQTELLRAEIASMKEKHGKEVEEMQNQISLYSEMLNEKPKDSNPVDTVENLDLQTELLRSEIVSLKEKHTQALEEMYNQISQYKEMLEQEKIKKLETSATLLSDPDVQDVESLRQELHSCLEMLKEEKEMTTQLRASQTKQQEICNQQSNAYKSTIEEMQDELKQVRVNLQQLSTDIEKLQEANRTLKQEKLDLLNSRDDVERKAVNLEETVRELQDDIKLLEEESSLLKSRITDLEEHIHIGKGMLNNKDEEIETLKLSLEEHIEMMDKEMKDKTEKIRELEEKLSKQTEEIHLASEKLTEMEISENQFSDKIVSLESEIDTYKEREAELNKVCNEYEEKIVILEADVEHFKVKNAEFEETCSEQEKHIDSIQLDLDIAQNKDSELKDIQQTYQEKISGLEAELKQVVSRAGETDNEKRDLEKKLEVVEKEFKCVNERMVAMEGERETVEEKWTGQLETANKEGENLKAQLHEMEEKLEIYSETVKDLQDEIRLSEEETVVLKSRVADLEEDIRKGKDIISENSFLKERVETLESEGKLSSELIAEYEMEVQGLRAQVTAQESSNIKEEEIQGLRADFDEQLKAIQIEKDSLKSDLEVLQAAKEQADQLAKTLQEEKESLNEDIFQLEKNLHPQAIKYHSLPENMEWEKKWQEFTREEKKKRVVLYSQIRGLKESLKFETEKGANVAEQALQELYKREKNTEVYAELRQLWKVAEDDANKLNDELQEEKKNTKELKSKLADLEERMNSKKGDYVSEDDHSCKFKLECFSVTRQLKETREEHIKRIGQYEETIQQYNTRIARMKNEMRRQQTNMDTTFDARSKLPSFDRETPAKQQQQHQSSGSSESIQTPVSMFTGSSKSGGIVDHFKVCITEAENKRLKLEMEKQKKKLAQTEELEKENNCLKDQLKKALENKDKKEKVEDVSLTSVSLSRHPLGEMVRKIREPVTETVSLEPLEKKEPRFKIPDLNPKTEDKLMKDTQDEVNNCKTN